MSTVSNVKAITKDIQKEDKYILKIKKNWGKDFARLKERDRRKEYIAKAIERRELTE